MKSITNYFCTTFNPQKPKEINYKTLVQAVNNHRIARITKIALFTIATVLTTATLVLSEADFKVGPLNFVLFGISLFLSGLFLRLNHIDKRYTEFVDDNTRANLVKGEIERVFHEDCSMSEKELSASLRSINNVLGNVVFDKEKVKFLGQLKKEANSAQKSLSLMAQETNKTELLNFSCFSRWTEAGQFGLPIYENEINVIWSLSPGVTEVSYKATPQESLQKVASPKEASP